MPPHRLQPRAPGLAGLLVATALTALAAAEPPAMRVESEVFVDRAAEPVSRSLTLFRDGLAWDFLDGAAPDAAGEIVLHDPARERLVVIDPARNVKTVVEAVRLDRLAASLASWARRSDDRLVRWAGGADFAEALVEKERKVELAGPRARYEVAYDTAPSPDAAERYGRFADAAILLRALLHPGGVPPFPRLALNRRIAAAGGIPTAVTLELDPRGGLVAGGPRVLRSVHKFHPRLLAADLDRLEDAEARVAVAEEVDLAAYAEPATARPVTAAK